MSTHILKVHKLKIKANLIVPSKNIFLKLRNAQFKNLHLILKSNVLII